MRILAVVAATLVLAGEAAACTCASEPLERRLDDADAAIVAHSVGEEVRDLRGAPQRFFTFVVEVVVKGDVGDTVVVRSPSGSTCDLEAERQTPMGLLLTRAPDGAWLANLCSVVPVGDLVAAGGEPRGGAIKVVLGVLFLGLVLSWALRRRARGVRPNLPGAPEP